MIRFYTDEPLRNQIKEKCKGREGLTSIKKPARLKSSVDFYPLD